VEVRGKRLFARPRSAAIDARQDEARPPRTTSASEVTEAVVTVPAYFDDAQRQATKDAGRIAGLDVLRIINEPTAAALAYGLDKTTTTAERVAVYDLGGGTFDVSILELVGGVFRVVSTAATRSWAARTSTRSSSTTSLGEFFLEHGIDLRGTGLALQRLKEAAERAKHELSSGAETEINLPFIAADPEGPSTCSGPLERGELERLVEPLVQRTLEPCAQALSDAGLSVGDIDVVLLVGGQTRMPRVQALVQEFFGRSPRRHGVNPDEVVAVGAAAAGRRAHRRGRGGAAARRHAAVARRRDRRRRVHQASSPQHHDPEPRDRGCSRPRSTTSPFVPSRSCRASARWRSTTAALRTSS
jgi:molecular chaperone DnaK